MKKNLKRVLTWKKKMKRLNKFLSECGIASRRKSEEYIKDGRVAVNGDIVISLSTTIDEFNDIVSLDGEIIKGEKKVYYLLNKPKRVITTTKDEKGRTAVINLIDTNAKIFPIGRLDYNTTGVLLLTNDGDFSNLLTHPKNTVPREYEVGLSKELKEEDKKKMLKGIYVEGKKGKFEKIEVDSRSYKKVIVTAVEGRNHFVKNMFIALGYFVDSLNRLSYAGLTAKHIPLGGYRELSKSEIDFITKKYKK